MARYCKRNLPHHALQSLMLELSQRTLIKTCVNKHIYCTFLSTRSNCHNTSLFGNPNPCHVPLKYRRPISLDLLTIYETRLSSSKAWIKYILGLFLFFCSFPKV